MLLRDPNDVLSDDILRIIFQLILIPDVKNGSSFSLVCKHWNNIASEQALWKDYVLLKWTHLATSKRIKNWKDVAKRRTIPKRARDATLIENCEVLDGIQATNLQWKFQCPMHWKNLKESSSSTTERFCSKCSKTVYHCASIEELNHHVTQKHCVAFSPNNLNATKDYFGVPILGSAQSGKSTLISHFKPLDNDVYVKPERFSYDAMTVVGNTSCVYFKEFHGESPYISFRNEDSEFDFEEPSHIVVIVYKDGDLESIQSAQQLKAKFPSECRHIMLCNKPGCEFKKMDEIIELDLSNAEHAKKVEVEISIRITTKSLESLINSMTMTVGMLEPLEQPSVGQTMKKLFGNLKLPWSKK